MKPYVFKHENFAVANRRGFFLCIIADYIRSLLRAEREKEKEKGKSQNDNDNH